MSFADRVCGELAELTLKKPCCRRALAAGFLAMSASKISGGVELVLRREVSASAAVEALQKAFAKAPDYTSESYYGHPRFRLRLASPGAAKLTASLQAEDASPEELLHFSACENCRSAFLRAAFLASGTVNDPHKTASLEFLPEVGAEALRRVLSDAGYPPACTVRQGRTSLYFKDSTAIGDVLALIGAHHTVFDFYDSRIERDIRNQENRATNFVTSNIQRSVSAATRQADIIRRLAEAGGLEGLPEALRETAILRFGHPEATLDELKNLHNPPISKSGLNHRLQKILEIAAEAGVSDEE